jgi:hypothetical protein
MLVGIGLDAMASLTFLELGQVNSDEGWYLYASKLVFQGQLPYRDFAYTQMPLLPYVYGVLQIIQPSIFWGRLTSILLSMGTLALSVVIARRYAGARAGGIAALLFAAFTLGIYFDSIVKTYALLSFCFTATLFVLSSKFRDEIKFPLAVIFAFGAALVRLTAVFFLAPVLMHSLIAARQRATRALILLECAAASWVVAFFLLPDWQAARWDLLDSHLNHWAGMALSSQINEILSARLPDIAQNFGLVILLGMLSVYFSVRVEGMRYPQGNRLPLLIFALGLGLFAAAHLANGLWATEYLVPAATSFLPILAIALSQVYGGLENQSRVLLEGTLIAVLLLLPLTESTEHIDLSGRRLPLAELDQVAAFVDQNSPPADKVLALEALNVVVDANRATLPGMTLAQFSVQNVDTATAQQLHVVNSEMVANAIAQKAARIVILTDADWQRLVGSNPADTENLQHWLDQNYRLTESMTRFGQFSQTIRVYVSR